MAASNQRTQRTRAKLHAAMKQIVQTVDYDQLTIQEIADAAGISRATFYLHYNDKNALLSAVIAEIIEAEFEQFRQGTLHGSLLATEPTLLGFRIIEKDHYLFRILLCTQSTSSLLPQLRIFVAQALEAQQRSVMSEEELSQLNVPLSLLCNFMASGFLGVAAWWLENDKPYSAEYISNVSRRLNMFGSLPFLIGGAMPSED